MRPTWIFCFKAAVKVSAEATFSSEGLTGEGPTPVPIHTGVGKMQFLKACWTEILSASWLLAGAGWFLVMWTSPTWQLTSSKQGESLQMREKLQSFVN